ncbi:MULTISPECIES: DUF6427 family protein [unclassified Kaistella]|uniref:DUF6427 family protein n=1 Tax=unclassified Kaistella TaxID=2762626 RepID=UPI002733B035|nr:MULTISPECIES: DUF6427 family protein [unclassified Kaistella]MDP2453306.1 DUF6427 family protein [Kaistella sp. SH11-4b]MDP2456363.1 DUF6427 family protein [Kaistella sp. SH40-3]MDP2459119.1 DUF6427 family protein [Kaistella sp. SH19-2b]
MFRLLSKESNIFSVPAYIGILLLIVISFNFLDFNTLEIISAIITFAGVALGYFCFNAIGLTYQTHLPLFLYTVFVFALYPGDLDIGIAVSLFTNSIIVLLLTNDNISVRNFSYMLVGSILALNFIFLPTTWPISIFVMFHIIGTSDRIGLHFFRLFFGMLLVALTYFGIAYFLGMNSWNPAYFPFTGFKPQSHFDNLLWLSPIVILLLHAVMDHFRNFNKKSPTSRFKYTFLLVFSLAQLITIVLYMGNTFEYLLLLALPASIILSRMLRFTKKYWMQETGLWVIIISLLIFKLTTYFNFF